MERNFVEKVPYSFLDYYTKEFVKKNDVQSCLKMFNLVKNSETHMKTLFFLKQPFLYRIRKVLKKRKENFEEILRLVNSFSCDCFACERKLEIGDECMIAEPIFDDDEREIFMKKTIPYDFHMNINEKHFRIHIWMIQHSEEDDEKNNPNPKNVKKWCLMMHGFGIDTSKHDWMKMVCPMFRKRKRNILLLDFPGFGRSSGEDLQSIQWKKYSNQMIFKILSYFHIKKNVSVFADCGGAAAFLKLLVWKPFLFGKRHILLRPTMGTFPKIEPILQERDIKLWVNWIVDDHHPLGHSSQKNWKRISKEMPKHLVYHVQKKGCSEKRITYYETQYTPGITRTGNSFNLLYYNEQYKNRILKWFDTQNKPKIKKKNN